MPRPKVYYKYEIPATVVDIVKTVIADYSRRKKAIIVGNANDNVIERYTQLNHIIDNCLIDVEEGIANDLINDIRLHYGYERSRSAMYISKNGYYRRRRKFIYDVAKMLDLL